MEIHENKTMTCIICPMGCQLDVTRVPAENGKIEFSVTGNTCPRGEKYAQKELTNPTRTLTCTVAVRNGVHRLVSAKTNNEVPRDMQLKCMEVVKRLSVAAPVFAGD